MNRKKEKMREMQDKLKELFQFDDQELDFGIYRIMNMKRTEIQQFIEEDLIETITDEIETVATDANPHDKLKELADKIEQTLGCSVDQAKEKYHDVPVVQQYLKKEAVVNTARKESHVEELIYDDILNFFSRYYDKGDFISKMRYSQDGKYAIPYNGEEVYLHWANSDQYYIKTTETFKHYRFKTGDWKVHFEVKVEEMETEQNNNLGEEKYFIYLDSEYDGATKDLHVYFGYRPLTAEEQEEVLNVYNDHYRTASNKLSTFSKGRAKTIMNGYNTQKILEKHIGPEFSFLNDMHILKNEQPSEKNEIEWHLYKYTAKNTTDYFIHKNLKAFLSRELDFYIKNEILHVDNILDEKDMHLEITRVKAFKKIALKIIAFLGEIEDFQKQLWLKKKFVLSTDYLITLDYIDEQYYPEILENEAQLKEWKERYSFDLDALMREPEDNTMWNKKEQTKEDILKANPTLCIDTAHFDLDFKYKILSEIEGVEEKTIGILIKSENFQALNLMQEKYKEKVNCCYIDPPYNTDATPILYKNGYKRSTWLSLMKNRLQFGDSLINKKNGYLSIAINDYELHNLYKLLEVCLQDREFFQIMVNHYPGSGTGRTNVTKTHEYNIYAIPRGKDILKGNIMEEGYRERGFCRSGTGENNYRIGRPNSFYAVLVDSQEKDIMGFEKPPSLEEDYPKDRNEDGYLRIYPLSSDGSERCWSLSYTGVHEHWENKELKCTENMTIIRKYYDEAKRSLLQSLWTNKKFNAATYGTNLLTHFFGNSGLFSFPKSLYTVIVAIDSGTFSIESPLILDYFAGSGTTGHAVLNINKKDEGERKFILVEMGDYFDTVLKPRIAKVIYSENWKNGAPEDNDGSSKQIIKYQRLEQYEDTLNNIDFVHPEQIIKDVSDYEEQQMFKFETKESNVFLNLDRFKSPFDYTIVVEKDNELVEEKVDLVETFNYLSGIYVHKIYQSYNKNNRYMFVEGEQNDKNVLVIWRNISEDFSPEEDRQYLTGQIKGLDKSFDTVYMNGCPTLAEAVSIDTEFKEKMWQDGSDA